MKVGKKNGFLNELKKNKILYLMIAPAVLYFFVFAYIPLGGLVVAFKDYNYVDGIFGSPWNGLKNFEFFFMSGQAWRLTKNTIVYNLGFMLVGTLFNIITGVVISEVIGKKCKRIIQSIILFPYFISWVVVSIILYNILNGDTGLLNSFLKAIGKAPVRVYNTPEVWIFLLMFLHIWKNAGYGSIFYITAITGFDTQCYEAAEIDGAGLFRRIWSITLPLLTPTIVTLLLLNLGHILRGNFDMFYQLVGSNGILYNSTDIIDTYVFRSLVDGTDIGMSSAAGFYQSVVCFVFIVVANKLVKMHEPDYSLF